MAIEVGQAAGMINAAIVIGIESWTQLLSSPVGIADAHPYLPI